MEQPLYELPEGWENRDVNSLSQEIVSGFACSKKHEDPNGYVHLRTNNIDTSGSLNFDTVIKIASDQVNSKKSSIRAGDIIFNNTNSQELVGKTCIVDQDYEYGFSNHLTRIRVSEEVLPQYFVYRFVQLQLTGHFSSICKRWIGQAGINTGILKQQIIPLPPLDEQKRIVAKLDALFTRVDAAITHLQETLELSKALFASALDEVIQLKSGNERQVKLGDVSVKVSTGPFGSMLHKSDYVSEGVPLVNPINIIGNKIVADKKKQVSIETKKRLGNYVLNVGDVVIARRGEIGRCAVVQPNQADWVCGTGCFFLTPGDHANPEYLAYLLRSSTYRLKLESQATGATIKNISNKALAGLEISLPPVKEQRRTVAHIKTLAKRTRTFEAETQERLDQLATLKSSLLDAAFRSQL